MKIYKVMLSSKQAIEIDKEDFDKLTREMGSGNLIKVKKAIINPSFIVAIVPENKEGKKQVEGYVDEKSGKFIVTGESFSDLLDDSFQEENKQLK